MSWSPASARPPRSSSTRRPAAGCGSSSTRGPGSGATSQRADRAVPPTGPDPAGVDASDEASPVEVELKLTVLDPASIRALVLDPASSLPGVRAVTEPRSVQTTDRYLDTAGGALRDRGLVARVRVGTEPPRLTVKSLARRGQGAVHRRLELEGEAGDGDDPHAWPPGEACDLLLEATGGAPLVALAIIGQTRLQREVAIGGSIVELSLDEVEVVRPGGGGDRWVELEGELRSGDEADLARLGDLLARRPDLEPATSSKLERALAALWGVYPALSRRRSPVDAPR